jgi:Arc/MetJ-type ribon-helix-helix transcriptional regulator
MTITLPNDLENSVQAAVHSGRFASVDDAMAEAVRLLLRELNQGQPQAKSEGSASAPDLGSIGAMRDAADELDEIVADAYRKRRGETWRDISVE